MLLKNYTAYCFTEPCMLIWYIYIYIYMMRDIWYDWYMIRDWSARDWDIDKEIKKSVYVCVFFSPCLCHNDYCDDVVSYQQRIYENVNGGCLYNAKRFIHLHDIISFLGFYSKRLYCITSYLSYLWRRTINLNKELPDELTKHTLWTDFLVWTLYERISYFCLNAKCVSMFLNAGLKHIPILNNLRCLLNVPASLSFENKKTVRTVKLNLWKGEYTCTGLNNKHSIDMNIRQKRQLQYITRCK